MELLRGKEPFCKVFGVLQDKKAPVVRKRVSMIGSQGMEIRKYVHRMICDREPILPDSGFLFVDDEGNKTPIELKDVLSKIEDKDGIKYEVEFLALKIIKDAA